MMKSIYCDTHTHFFNQLTDNDQIAELINDPKHVFWLDLQQPTEQELATIANLFKLHPLAIEDASNEHQRPKVEEYEHFLFLVFHTINLDASKRELLLEELDAFVGANYLITVHNQPIRELDEVEQRWKRSNAQVEKGIGILLYSLLDTIVDHYFPAVDELVDQAEALEDRMFAEARAVRERQLTLDLLALKKQFLAFRRIASPERDVLNTLTNRDSPFFTEHITIYFRDVYDHVARLNDTLDLYRDQLSTIMDANLSIVSNDLNKIMRTLTVMSIVLMVDALVVGIYGMNFDYMPELHLHYGYFAVLLLMLIVSGMLVALFRRMGWF
ncbi:MAG TPA: magnesium/cobalt transporter CorA [Ktedonobacteraceae bacterium]